MTILFLIFKKVFKAIYNYYLSIYLSNINLDSIDSLSGKEFEDLVYCIFSRLNFDISKTKSSHDYGADLILKIKNISFTIQCKLYYKHSIGISAVQEVYSSLKHYNASIGIVLTNSYFSKSAITLAENTSVLLWDRNTLSKLLKMTKLEKKEFCNQLMLINN